MCFKSKSSSAAPASSAPVTPTATAPTATAPTAKPPAAVPPVTERTIEVDAASRQTKIDAKKRKGLRSTLLAGETGGYQAPEGEQKKTLLG